MLDGNWYTYRVRTFVNDDGNMELERIQIKYLEDDDLVVSYFIKPGYGWSTREYRYPYFMLDITGYETIAGSFLSYDWVQKEIIAVSKDMLVEKYLYWRDLKRDYGIKHTFE